MIDLEILKSVEKSHLKFAEDRGIEKTYCPSEVAKIVFAENWREEMELVRKIADELVKAGILVVLQKGEIQSKLPSKIKGPIRLRKK